MDKLEGFRVTFLAGILKRIEYLIILTLCSAYGSLFAVTEAEYAAAINVAGRQRMLTQKMAKESLFVSLGVNKEQNKTNREKTIKLFESSLGSLIAGSGSDSIPKPPNNSITQKLNVVKNLWPEYKKAIQSGSAAQIAKLSVPILKKMNSAVKSYETAFFKAGFKGSGKTINIAGRQRMLTQKMAKEALLISSNTEVIKSQEMLKNSINLFDISLKGLINGNAEMRIEKVNNPEIQSQLLVVQKKWEEYKKLFNADGKGLSQEALINLEKQSPEILFEMNKAVGMYEDDVKKNKKT